MSNFEETDHIDIEDFVMIVQNGCVKIISYEEFIKKISLGGFSIMESWLNGIDGIGLWSDGVIPIDTPPTMQDITFQLENRTQNHIIPSDDFLNKFNDVDGDLFGKIVVSHGDVSGYTYNGQPLYIGQILNREDLINGTIEYDAKNQDAAYGQEWFFETYDENNVKAQ